MTDLKAAADPRQLGRTDVRASAIGWGMWRFAGDDVAASQAKVEAALDAGLTLLDTADIYGPDNGEPFGAAEALLGRVLKAAPGLRARMTLATKGGIRIGDPYNSAPAYIVKACEESLRRMGVDVIDLYQIHRPDVLTHPHDLAEALTRLHAAGKVRAVGVSNYTLEQTRALEAALSFPLASTQPELSPLAIAAIDDGVLDHALARGHAVLAWSPLGGGRLGAVAPADPRARAVAEALDAAAAASGVSRAAAAYAWIMLHPARPIPLVGSQQVARITEAADAFKVTMTRAQWYAVFAAARGAPLP